MKNELKFEIVQRFFEPPNFSMLSQGEETVVAAVCSREVAERFAEVYALETLRSYGGSKNGFTVTFGGDVFCVIRFGEYTASVITIIERKIEE